MKQAVMYGAGNIGRGFIGLLFSESGYEVTFIDVLKDVVDGLCERQSYPIRYVSNDGYDDILVRNVTAVDGNDIELASDKIASCDIMATAVGARILPRIAPVIISGLRKRMAKNAGPINIIICENINDANKVLEKILKDMLTPEEVKWFDENVGLVEASIGRMVPVQTDEMKAGDPLRVCVERYGFLPVDKDAFKGVIPDITNMVPVSPFDFYVKRKLFVHNMGHATCAYLGDFLNYDFIWQSIDLPDIRIIVENAMIESAQALSKHYSMDLSDILNHISDLLNRFTNRALGDTCERVGRDPARKIGINDRLIGASRLALKENIYPSYITAGAAAALFRFICEDEDKTQSVVRAGSVLEKISEIKADSDLGKMILKRYELFLEKKDISEILRTADTDKAAHLVNII